MPPDVTQLRLLLSQGKTCQMGVEGFRVAALMEGEGLQAKSSPVTLRGTSGCRADKMRSDMPSPLLSVMPPH